MESEPEHNEDADFFKTLNNLGIPPEVVAQLLQQLPKVVSGVARGSIQFALEEKAIQDNLQRTAQEKVGLLTQAIFSVRSFLLTMVGFSLTAIGVVLAAIFSSDIDIFDNFLLLLGLVLLVINVVGSISYILYIYTVEVNSLKALLDFDRDTSSELREMISRYQSLDTATFTDYQKEKHDFIEKKKEEEKSLRKVRGKDWVPHILSACFVSGIVSLILAIFWLKT
jgi:hypothetical protein